MRRLSHPPKCCQSFQVLPQELSPRLRPCKSGLGVEVGYPVPAPKVVSVSQSFQIQSINRSRSRLHPEYSAWETFRFPEAPQALFLIKNKTHMCLCFPPSKSVVESISCPFPCPSASTTSLLFPAKAETPSTSRFSATAEAKA